MRKISSYTSICLLVLAFISCQGAETPLEKNKATASKHSHGPELVETFSAKWLDGKSFASKDFRGQKLVLGFFSYKHRDASAMLKALSRLKPLEKDYNFKVLLVSIDHGKEAEIKKFLQSQKIDLPVIVDDAGLSVAEKFKVESEVTMMALSPKHEPIFGIRKYIFADKPGGEDVFLDYVKENLSVKAFKGAEPRLGFFPQAPQFTATTFQGQTISMSDYLGKKAVLVIFFSPKCPHCQNEMRFLRDKVYPEYKDKGLEILVLSVLPLEGKTLELYKSFKFTWPVIEDSKRRIRNLFSSKGSIPENFFVSKKGRVKYYSAGYSPGSHDLYHMRFKALLGLPNIPKLSSKKFNGPETCLVCHEEEYSSWAVTPHAHAWATLEIKGEDGNKECIECHSLGFNDSKGFKAIKHPKTGKEIIRIPERLKNVSCEHCHGIGGPHVTEENMMAKETLKKGCLTCHTEKFSLHFDFDKRLEKVDHSDKEKIASLTEKQRLEMIKKVSKKPEDLFDTSIKYTGSQSCATCHGEIVKKWEKSKHGHAFETLKKAGQEKKADCLQCHTVGYGDESGYTAHVGDQSFEAVGCESCHGPGEKHIQSKKKEDIRGLGDDCPFCVIEQICLSCHDSENSPNFNIHKGLESVSKDHGK